MQELIRDYRDIVKDYVLDDTIFSEESDKVRRVKDIVLNRLDQVERTMILLYADCGSLRVLGKRMGMSYGSVKNVIDKIVEKIFSEYYKMVAQETNEHIHTTLTRGDSR